MRTLLVMRHGKSSWKDPSLADHDRPLTKRGRRASSMMGQFLSQQGLLPEVVLCSAATRARETAREFQAGAGQDLEIRFLEEIYAATGEQLLEHVRRVSGNPATVMIIGHNPALDDVVERLTHQAAPLKTATIARIELKIVNWSDVSFADDAVLRDVWYPRAIE